ncbi:MAG: LLM class flavin-dependent oxidoreductase [Thaumarchaeota archaeon]|nr:LLM class flavin-dependent oxidoreductase [Nitrososphaerota archaeon]
MVSLTGFSIGFSGRQPVSDILDLASQAENLGFDQIWLAESYHHRSATSLAAALASSTTGIRIGLGLLSPYTRHPALAAMEAATLDEISKGRLTVAFGAAKSAMSRHGLKVEDAKPAQAIADMVNIVRSLLAGKKTFYQGRILKIPPPGVGLELKPSKRIPIYVGGANSLVLRVGGMVGDGVILMCMSSPSYVKYAVGEMTAGAKKADRSVDSIDLAAYLVISVARRRRDAINAAKPLISWYIPKVMKVVLDSAGLTDRKVEGFKKAVEEMGYEKAADLIDDDTLDRLCIAGTPEEVAEKIVGYMSNGLKEPIAYEVLGPDRKWALKALAREVRPQVEVLLRR